MSVTSNPIAKKSSRRNTISRAIDRAIYEPLEERRLFALVGINVANVFPNVQSLSPGMVQDQGAPSLVGTAFSATSTNLALNRMNGAVLESDLISADPSANPPVPDVSSIQILVNNTGAVTGGNGPVDGSNTDDLLLIGKVTDASNNVLFDGVLLTGTILQFGYQFNSAPSPFPSLATFDFRFHATGGLLDIPGYFGGSDIGLTYTGQSDTPFPANPFASGFSLTAPKATVVPIPPLGTISGTKSDDLTGNSFSSDDTPQGGVTINLYQGNSAAGSPLATTVTANDGSYSFANLVSGTYFVQETLPAGTTETGGAAGYVVLLTNGLDANGNVLGSNSTGNNFDNFTNFNISGTKLNDLTGNGNSFDDTGLPGVTIDLFLNGGATPVATTVTGADGAYSFNNLGPGNYAVQEEVPAGWTQTVGNNGYTTIGTSGQNVTGDNFEDFQNINFSGNKYNDITGNSFSGDDTPQAGVTINLYRGNSSSGTLIATTTSGADGSYSFSNIGPGTYFVNETVPAGATATGGANGYVFVATSGSNITNQNFDNFTNVNISGTKFNDLTGNSFSADDTPQGGVTVNLYKGTSTAGTLVASTTTASTGAVGTYSFSNLGPGTYFVQEVVPAGSTQTGGNAGYTIVANSGANSTGDNFDNFSNITIGGTKYNDITGNSFSSDDTAQAGVKIDLFKNGGSTPVATATTAANGTFSFANLGPGVYFVQEELPAGSVQTGGNAGYTTNASSGVNVSNDNFDNFQLISISGKKFNDLTNNGFSADDPGLAGVTINLFKNGGTTPFASAVTGADGSYSFTNLAPGTYTVKEVVPTGWIQTGGDAGYTVVAKSGQNCTGDNFDDFQTITISGIKYKDLTGNSFSSDDTPLGGVTVKLFKDANNDGVLSSADGAAVATTTTANGTGAYSFTGLMSGTYFVQEVVPTGWISTGTTTTYTIKTATTPATKSYTGNNFDNFYEECHISNCTSYYYIIDGCSTHYTTLNNHVHEGDHVTVYFNIKTPDVISLVSYTAPGPNFDPNTASQQVVFDQASGSFSAGWHSLSVCVPMCYFQIDFVCGPVIDHLGPPSAFYSPQLRLFDADNGGTDACFTGCSKLSGYVFNDVNKDKSFKSPDQGLAGVTITLSGIDISGHSVHLTRITGSNGLYTFAGLKMGMYTITESAPSGYTDSVNLVGTVNGSSSGTAKNSTSTDQIANILLLQSNSVGINYDFAELKK